MIQVSFDSLLGKNKTVFTKGFAYIVSTFRVMTGGKRTVLAQGLAHPNGMKPLWPFADFWRSKILATNPQNHALNVTFTYLTIESCSTFWPSCPPILQWLLTWLAKKPSRNGFHITPFSLSWSDSSTRPWKYIALLTLANPIHYLVYRVRQWSCDKTQFLPLLLSSSLWYFDTGLI